MASYTREVEEGSYIPDKLKRAGDTSRGFYRQPSTQASALPYATASCALQPATGGSRATLAPLNITTTPHAESAWGRCRLPLQAQARRRPEGACWLAHRPHHHPCQRLRLRQRLRLGSGAMRRGRTLECASADVRAPESSSQGRGSAHVLMHMHVAQMSASSALSIEAMHRQSMARPAAQGKLASLTSS